MKKLLHRLLTILPALASNLKSAGDSGFDSTITRHNWPWGNAPLALANASLALKQWVLGCGNTVGAMRHWLWNMGLWPCGTRHWLCKRRTWPWDNALLWPWECVTSLGKWADAVQHFLLEVRQRLCNLTLRMRHWGNTFLVFGNGFPVYGNVSLALS